MLFEGIEVPVMMEQLVAGFNAEGSDQEVNRCANGIRFRSEESIIPGSGEGERDSARVKNIQVQQAALNSRKLPVAANALQYFAEDQIRNANSSHSSRSP